MTFEFVHTAPETTTTLNRMAIIADRAGFSALVVRNHSDAVSDSFEFETAPDIPLSVYSGVEIRADSVDQLHGYVGKYVSRDIDVICVHGGDETINRAAVSVLNIDVLCHPYHARGLAFDHVLVREAAENGVALEFNLSNVLRA
ncbi:MAG: RNase P subunit p30 family protein, partial [Halobacteria archaeon]|nr:RNase P subunit p30 family protein [Halobacteria archaeon]